MPLTKFTDIIRYFTIQIRTSRSLSGALTGSGTGFTFGLQAGDLSYPFLITNKHVLDGAASVELTLHVADPNGDPLPGPGRPVRFALSQVPVLRHPDPGVDLAAIALAPVMSMAIAAGWQPFAHGLGPNTIPKADVRAGFGAIETVTMVGYPVGLADFANNAPIIRQGITATPLTSNYRGQREFLVDMAVFPGSSGSPILVVNEGAWSQGDGLVVGNRLHLVGILHSGHTRTESGEIRQETVPTRIETTVTIRQMVHLGICLHADRIIEMINSAGLPELAGHPELSGF